MASTAELEQSRRLPRDRWPESTLALRADPYRFIARRARELQTDVFSARILLQPTICMTGREAARLFYDARRFTREGAAPRFLRHSLLGTGGVQMLDGTMHAERKQLLLSLLTEARVASLMGSVRWWLRRYARHWCTQEHVRFHDECRELLTRAVCDWAGVPLGKSELPRRTRELSALFDGAGAPGPEHLRARRARRSLEHWLGGLVAGVRRGRLILPPPGAAHAIATWRDARGELLPETVAAVEILNLLRPTVAVSVYLADAVHALWHHPEALHRLAAREPGFQDAFILELRRWYPFFPAVAARVREDFQWAGYEFPAGRRVLLDLYGTCHDPRLWSMPDRFDPDRFRDRPPGLHDLVPQGGGDVATGHRCAGEAVIAGILAEGLELLVHQLRFTIPPQDLTLDMRRLPALPRSRVVLTKVQLRG